MYLTNRSSTAALGGIAPLQFRTKETIDLAHMRVFGSPAQIFVRATIRDDKNYRTDLSAGRLWESRTRAMDTSSWLANPIN